METDLSGNLIDEFVFFGGQRIARRTSAGTVFYYFKDHLGSSRVIVQAGQATPCYDADYLPFGYEKTYTDTCPQNYKFTGKERDGESGLDYFVARHYASTLGRFLQPDAPFADQRPANPQTWNLYSYARNNPLVFVDPTGRAGSPWGPPASGGGGITKGSRSAQAAAGSLPVRVTTIGEKAGATVPILKLMGRSTTSPSRIQRHLRMSKKNFRHMIAPFQNYWGQGLRKPP